jgi:hypothetical protein
MSEVINAFREGREEGRKEARRMQEYSDRLADAYDDLKEKNQRLQKLIRYFRNHPSIWLMLSKEERDEIQEVLQEGE